jgi:hypothetical protein
VQTTDQLGHGKAYDLWWEYNWLLENSIIPFHLYGLKSQKELSWSKGIAKIWRKKNLSVTEKVLILEELKKV